jgi:uncharacterized protein with HEPN domain
VRRDEDYLGDILDAIQQIDKYAAFGRTRFDSDELVQVWMIYHIQVIGEAASKISGEGRKKAPGITWSVIVGMRNVLVHDYFGIDLREVWKVVERDLPELKRQVEAVIGKKA